MLVRAAYAKVLGPRAIALPARAAGAAHESDALMHERSDSAGVGRRVSTRAASSRLEPAAQDVVVVGGGIVGCATAFFLKQRDPSISVKVVERDSSYQYASTVLSVGGFRQQWCTKECVDMSLFGAEFALNAREMLAVEGIDPAEADVQFTQNGYLFLASSEQAEANMRCNVGMQREGGAETTLLTPSEMSDKFPWLSVDDVRLGSWGRRLEGWLDPWSLLHGLRRKAVDLGVEFITDAVVGMDVDATTREVRSVHTAGAGDLVCGAVVNAAGCYSNVVAEMAGVTTLPVRARRRCVWVFHCPTGTFEACPLVVDSSGVYFRREGTPAGGTFLAGYSPPDDPDCEGPHDLIVDHELFDEVLWPALAHRVPMFEQIRVTASWAGFYDYNTWDQNALIGVHPQCPNMYHGTGFSGHGLQHGPATGRALAELIVGGHFETLDLKRFAVDRYERGDKIVESEIV